MNVLVGVRYNLGVSSTDVENNWIFSTADHPSHLDVTCTHHLGLNEGGNC